MSPLLVAILVCAFLFLLFLLNLNNLIIKCGPNEVLIISGGRRREGQRILGYRLIKGGRGIRIPLVQRVDRMDLTNMVIDVTATNAYCKGGIPLIVQGVANVKIAGHEPVMNNAIERFLNKPRAEIMEIAKATLEGSLRGVLATLTPEQVNEDKILFAERLVQEVEADMTSLGMVVDTLKIQSVSDDVGYLESIGRKKSAEVVANARVAEAIAKADAVVRSCENQETEVRAQVDAELEVAKAEAQRKLSEILSRREALIAEEKASVAALLAQAEADVKVQTARLEQVRNQLTADVVQPAKAASEVAEAKAKADVAPILEDGKARALALTTLAESWKEAGDHAREIFLLQKLQPILAQITDTISSTPIERVTVIGTGGPESKGPAQWLPMLEQIREIYGIDLVEKVQSLGKPSTTNVQVVLPEGESAESTPPGRPASVEKPPVREKSIHIPRKE
ncbi:MAG TPA: SPFH domain-containing protein [Fimbriimonadaceae bacterium]|nr:SPFH domain-containing protein [Fimbriimonadaceae bacterium]HRJ32352.1 SPFH domain-containing protein [Fimbriimonadaceae bacterium]